MKLQCYGRHRQKVKKMGNIAVLSYRQQMESYFLIQKLSWQYISNINCLPFWNFQGEGQGHSRSKISFSWITSELFTKCNSSKKKKLYQGVINIYTKICKNWTIFVGYKGVMSLTKLDCKVKYQFVFFSKYVFNKHKWNTLQRIKSV